MLLLGPVSELCQEVALACSGVKFLYLHTELESGGFVLRWSQETHVRIIWTRWMEMSVENGQMRQ